MNLRNSRVSLLITLSVLAVLMPTAHANVFTFVTPAGSTTSGGPVSATATAYNRRRHGNHRANRLTVESQGRCAVDQRLRFRAQQWRHHRYSDFRDWARRVTVAGNGSFVLAGSRFALYRLATEPQHQRRNTVECPGRGQPTDLIIGPPGGATYSNANSSIAGNGPHNPFVNQTGTFVVTVAGVTAATNITSATFSFGTTQGDSTFLACPGRAFRSRLHWHWALR